MKISISKNIFESILINIQPFLDKKDLSQITSHIQISTFNDVLEIRATDHEIGLFTNTKNIKIIDNGKATANGKRILDIVKGLKDEEIILETINDNLYIKQKNSKFKIPMLNPEDFPTFPDIENKSKFNVNSSVLIRSFKKISPVIDINNPKYELNGALIDIKEKNINLVATDSKRLAIYSINNENETENNFSLIIPKKAILEIQKLFTEKIDIYYDENIMLAKSNNYTFYTKLINGNFPNYEKVIPQEQKIQLLLNRDKIIESIRQIIIVSQEIKIIFKQDKIIFESLNNNIEAKIELEVNTGLTEPIQITTHCKHVIDFLSNIESPNFTLKFNEELLPYVLESENFKTIIMPIIN